MPVVSKGIDLWWDEINHQMGPAGRKSRNYRVLILPTFAEEAPLRATGKGFSFDPPRTEPDRTLLFMGGGIVTQR